MCAVQSDDDDVGACVPMSSPRHRQRCWGSCVFRVPASADSGDVIQLIGDSSVKDEMLPRVEPPSVFAGRGRAGSMPLPNTVESPIPEDSEVNHPMKASGTLPPRRSAVAVVDETRLTVAPRTSLALCRPVYLPRTCCCDCGDRVR